MMDKQYWINLIDKLITEINNTVQDTPADVLERITRKYDTQHILQSSDPKRKTTYTQILKGCKTQLENLPELSVQIGLIGQHQVMEIFETIKKIRLDITLEMIKSQYHEDNRVKTDKDFYLDYHDNETLSRTLNELYALYDKFFKKKLHTEEESVEFIREFATLKRKFHDDLATVASGQALPKDTKPSHSSIMGYFQSAATNLWRAVEATASIPQLLPQSTQTQEALLTKPKSPENILKPSIKFAWIKRIDAVTAAIDQCMATRDKDTIREITNWEGKGDLKSTYSSNSFEARLKKYREELDLAEEGGGILGEDKKIAQIGAEVQVLAHDAMHLIGKITLRACEKMINTVRPFHDDVLKAHVDQFRRIRESFSQINSSDTQDDAGYEAHCTAFVEDFDRCLKSFELRLNALDEAKENLTKLEAQITVLYDNLADRKQKAREARSVFRKIPALKIERIPKKPTLTETPDALAYFKLAIEENNAYLTRLQALQPSFENQEIDEILLYKNEYLAIEKQYAALGDLDPLCAQSEDFNRLQQESDIEEIPNRLEKARKDIQEKLQQINEILERRANRLPEKDKSKLVYELKIAKTLEVKLQINQMIRVKNTLDAHENKVETAAFKIEPRLRATLPLSIEEIKSIITLDQQLLRDINQDKDFYQIRRTLYNKALETLAPERMTEITDTFITKRTRLLSDQLHYFAPEQKKEFENLLEKDLDTAERKIEVYRSENQAFIRLAHKYTTVISDEDKTRVASLLQKHPALSEWIRDTHLSIPVGLLSYLKSTTEIDSLVKALNKHNDQQWLNDTFELYQSLDEIVQNEGDGNNKASAARFKNFAIQQLFNTEKPEAVQQSVMNELETGIEHSASILKWFARLIQYLEKYTSLSFSNEFKAQYVYNETQRKLAHPLHEKGFFKKSTPPTSAVSDQVLPEVSRINQGQGSSNKGG